MFISGQVSAQKRTIGMEIIKKQMQMNHEYLFYTLVGYNQDIKTNYLYPIWYKQEDNYYICTQTGIIWNIWL